MYHYLTHLSFVNDYRSESPAVLSQITKESFWPPCCHHQATMHSFNVAKSPEFDKAPLLGINLISPLHHQRKGCLRTRTRTCLGGDYLQTINAFSTGFKFLSALWTVNTHLDSTFFPSGFGIHKIVVYSTDPRQNGRS